MHNQPRLFQLCIMPGVTTVIVQVKQCTLLARSFTIDGATHNCLAYAMEGGL